MFNIFVRGNSNYLYISSKKYDVLLLLSAEICRRAHDDIITFPVSASDVKQPTYVQLVWASRLRLTGSHNLVRIFVLYCRYVLNVLKNDRYPQRHVFTMLKYFRFYLMVSNKFLKKTVMTLKIILQSYRSVEISVRNAIWININYKYKNSPKSFTFLSI